MNNNKVKLIIGFITYGEATAKYLPYFLPSLTNQTFKDFKVIVFDNSNEQNNENTRYIKKKYGDIKIDWTGQNLGFARGYNKMINKASELGAQYFLVINPDIILEPDAIAKMLNATDSNKELGSVCPKILQWDFQNNKKTNIIDSLGIKLKSGLRFIDLGQGSVDSQQFNNLTILGPSGAAAMYRISALEKVKQDNLYFDELMFMYKEDCDLAYRLHLAGFKAKCVQDATLYHDRSVKGEGESNLEVVLNRKLKSKQVKEWSFLGQQIIFRKFWHLQNPKEKIAIVWYQIKILIFILLFEQYLLGQLKKLWTIRKQIKIYQ